LIKNNYFEAYSNLATNLKMLGKIDEAEKVCRKAISINPKYAKAHFNLGLILYSIGKADSALKSFNKAKSINPRSRVYKLVTRLIEAKINKKTHQNNIKKLNSNPLILSRNVESKLITSLYEMKALNLDMTNDPSYGNARGSGYYLFDDKSSNPIIKKVEKDLINIIKKAIKNDIYIEDSFYTILGAGGGVHCHNHLTSLDKDSNLNLANQKFSLVYYLSVGDQNCSNPGVLKLYDPVTEILPSQGMITIFPADRLHSVNYNGIKDRVIIGINFYTL
jgi:tetratricopeptide (TPR) repeat protein